MTVIRRTMGVPKVPLLLPLLLLFVIPNITTATDEPELKVEHGCDGDSLVIRCDPGFMIDVLKTMYGRINLYVCNEKGIDYAHRGCVYNNTEEIKRRCHGRPACLIKVDPQYFVDYCPGTPKFLQFEYYCVPEKDATTTDSTTTTTTTTTERNIPVSTASQQAQEYGTATETPTKCAGQLVRDIQWPDTEVGHWANMPCPNDPDKSASWLCSSSGQWTGNSADLSDCRSAWARHLQRRLVHVDTVETCIQMIDVLQTNTSTSDQIFGGDTLVAAQVLETVVERMNKLLPGKYTDDRKQFAQELNKRVASTVNNLLHKSQSPSWSDLPVTQQQSTAAKLLHAVEQSSLLLAENMAVGDRTHTSKEKNLFVEVAVVELRANSDSVQFPGTLLNSANRIDLPYEALQTSAMSEAAAVSFAEFTTLGSVLAPVSYVSTRDNGLRQTIERTVASNIISANILGVKPGLFLKQPVSITFNIQKNANWHNNTCAFWNDTVVLNGGRVSGQWQTTGCMVHLVNSTHTICRCHHLTSFAVLMDVHGSEMEPEHDVALTLITYVGCTISVVCLLASLLLFCMFSHNQSHTHCSRMMVHAHLCLCLLVAEVLFMLGIAQTEQPVLCTATAVSLHYFFLAAFAWMFLEGFELYQMLVTVYDRGTDRRLYYVFGYGAPALIVGVSVALGLGKYGTPDYCWLTTEDYAIMWFVAPVLVVVLANIAFLTLAAMQVCKYRRHDSKRRQLCGQIDPDKLSSIVVWLKGAWALIVLLGITWLSGLLYVNQDTVFWAYVFTILNSLQGCFIFLFHIYWNDRLRRRCMAIMNARRASSIPRGPPNFVNVFDHNGKAQPFGFNFANSSDFASSPVPDSHSTELSNSNQLPGQFYRGDTVERAHCAQDTPLLNQHSIYSNADDQYDCVGYSSSMLAYPIQQPAHQPITPSQDPSSILRHSGNMSIMSMSLSSTAQPTPYRCPPRFDPPPPPNSQPPPSDMSNSTMYLEPSEHCSTSDYDRSASAAHADCSLSRSGYLVAAGSPKQRSLSADSAYSDEREAHNANNITMNNEESFVGHGYELPDSVKHVNSPTTPQLQESFAQFR